MRLLSYLERAWSAVGVAKIAVQVRGEETDNGFLLLLTEMSIRVVGKVGHGADVIILDAVAGLLTVARHVCEVGFGGRDFWRRSSVKCEALIAW